MTGEQHQDPADAADDREAWIAAAAADIRDHARAFDLVPPDHPTRQWEPGLAILVEKQGAGLARAAKAAAARAIEAARQRIDLPGEARATQWRTALGRTALGERYGQKSLDRWLDVADMFDQALNDWLPDDAATVEQRQAIAHLQQIRQDRAEALRTATAEALAAAIEAEQRRRQDPEAWEDELEQRRQDQAQREAADIARAVENINRDSLLASLRAPERFCVLPPYELDLNGVFLVRPSEKGDPHRERIATAPLVVVRVFVDPAGDQLVELAWRDGHQAITRIVPRAVAKSGRTLVKMLGNAGIPVVEADARSVERYLAAVEADNRNLIPRERLARQLGWQPDGEFVTGPASDRHIEVRDEQRSALSAHHAHGSLAGWQAAIKAIDKYLMPRAMVAASFAAPLLEVLDLDSFTVDLSGRSTGGKTVSGMAALSVWADPQEKGGGIFSWRTTLYKAEMRLNLCNGLPVLFDETRAVKVEGLVDQVLYQVPMNRGTGRGGDYASELPWRTILLSTGEQTALSFTTHEGASARVLCLRGAPFGRDGEASAQAANQLRDAVFEHYGVAGPAFAAELRTTIAAEAGAEKIRTRHRELTKEHQGGNDVANRRAKLIAALRLAAELAYEWNICPLPSLEAEQWATLFAAEQERDDRGETALEVVREFVSRNPHRMWPYDQENPPALGLIGAYLEIEEKDGTRRRTVALLPEALGEELARRGYKVDAIRQAWTEAKMISLDDKGQLQRRRGIGDKSQLRVYEFDRAMFEGTEQPASPDTREKPAPSATARLDDGPCEACGWPLGSIAHEDQCGGGWRQ